MAGPNTQQAARDNGFDTALWDAPTIELPKTKDAARAEAETRDIVDLHHLYMVQRMAGMIQ